MKKLKMIRVETDTGVSVISICNYDKYQDRSSARDTAPIQHRYSTDTNEKKGERKKKEEAIASLCDGPKRFDEFWAIYPHRGGAKKGRKASEAKYAAAVRRGVPEQDIIAGAERYGGDRGVVDGYAKNPETWLNGVGWQDEIETKTRMGMNGNGSTVRGSKGADRAAAFLRGARGASGLDRGADIDPAIPLLAGR
jgi:hypothetical protein